MMYHRARAVWLLLMILTVAAPAWATPLTFDFTGAQGYSGGTVTGSFTYESTEAPSAYNVHNLTPNVTYALQSWDFTIALNYGDGVGVGTSLNGAPSIVTWSNLLANNTSEFCLGKCIFSSTRYDRLLFSNGLQTLQLVFQSPNTGSLPRTVMDWGPLYAVNAVNGGASWFDSKTPDGRFQVEALLTGGSLT